jgi:acyl-CoA carboxylase epsilon subunit
MTDDPSAGELRLRIIKGEPTPEELAALVAVLMARQSVERPSARPPSGWAAPAHRMRRVLSHGPGAWRASALPH